MSNAELQALKEQRTALIKVINQMYVQQQYTDEMGNRECALYWYIGDISQALGGVEFDQLDDLDGDDIDRILER